MPIDREFSNENEKFLLHSLSPSSCARRTNVKWFRFRLIRFLSIFLFAFLGFLGFTLTANSNHSKPIRMHRKSLSRNGIFSAVRTNSRSFYFILFLSFRCHSFSVWPLQFPTAKRQQHKWWCCERRRRDLDCFCDCTFHRLRLKKP